MKYKNLIKFYELGNEIFLFQEGLNNRKNTFYIAKLWKNGKITKLRKISAKEAVLKIKCAENYLRFKNYQINNEI